MLHLIQQASFDVFVTINVNLEYQQNLQTARFALIMLSAPDNTFETLHPLMPKILAALQIIKIGEIIRIEV